MRSDAPSDLRRLAQNRVRGRESSFVVPARAERDSLSLEDAAELLARMRQEITDYAPLLIEISDMLSQEAAESLERAEAQQVTQATAERRNRGKGRQVVRPVDPRSRRTIVSPSPEQFFAKRKRGKYGKRQARTTDPASLDRTFLKVPWKTDARGMADALTADFEAVNVPTALREISGGTLFWGTQKFLRWTSYHMQLTTPEGRTKWMPARIDFMTGESATTISDNITSITEGWIRQMMARAGAPEDWLSEQLPNS